MNITNYRLRIAPSPTGYPHIGTIYQALFNYAYSKRYEGVFIVRIEDTDRARLVEDAEKVIYEALDWFGLTEDESPRKGGSCSPYRQSERLDIYQKYAQQLVEKGLAYFDYYPSQQAGQKKDYSSAEQSPLISSIVEIPPAPKSVAEMLEKKDWVLRMKVPVDGTIKVTDGVRGEITFDYKQISSQVLLKSDGYPTYHLAVVIDDHLMEISHILRAEEWISSLPKHVLLYKYFEWRMPPVFHTATLRNPDKSKLSKRQGHTNVTWYREEGYLPEAILNYLAQLGWSHPAEKEIFSLDEFISLFDLKDIRPIAPIFDLNKLNWLNQQYIQNMSDEDLLQRLIKYDPSLGKISKTLLEQLMPLVKTRMQTLKEFQILTEHFITPPVKSTDEMHKKIAQNLLIRLSKLEKWDSEHILTIAKDTMEENKIRMPVLYLILTGHERGLPLPESLVILGKDTTLKRLQVYV